MNTPHSTQTANKILMFILFLSVGCMTARKAATRDHKVNLTVTHVEKFGERKEVWAKSGYRLYRADCVGIPDSIKAGTVIAAVPCSTKIQCPCAFVRIK